MGRGLGHIPPLDGRESGAGEYAAIHHAVAAGLQDRGEDVVELLGDFHPGLGDAPVVDGIGIEPLDLGDDRRVVGFLRIQLVVAHHVQADLLGLSLVEVGHADAIGARVIEDVDRLYLQGVAHVVSHVRALIGIRRDRAEIDRLAARLVLAGEFRIGDVGIGGRGRDGRQVGGREDGRHRLALAAHLRADDGDHSRIRDEFLGIGGGLGRVVLPGGGGAAVEHGHVQLVAAGAALAVHVIDRHHRAVLDAGCRIGIGARQRQLDADGDGLVLRVRRHEAGRSGEGHGAQGRQHELSAMHGHVLSPCYVAFKGLSAAPYRRLAVPLSSLAYGREASRSPTMPRGTLNPHISGRPAPTAMARPFALLDRWPNLAPPPQYLQLV